MNTSTDVAVYAGDALARYGFGDNHPFGPDRFYAFWSEFQKQGLDRQVAVLEPVAASREAIERFHSAAYVDLVIRLSESGSGFLDSGDTPAFAGMFEAAACVVGSVLDAARRIVHGEYRSAFVPIAGLHHARRDAAAGFCVFNDCGVLIETLRSEYAIERVAYVDIDAHHGDGVFYSFEDDPMLSFVDLHEDGRYLYPGTGDITESGKGAAKGTKLNIPMPPGADDTLFMSIWPRVEKFIEKHEPEFIVLQCGADSLEGDPITHLRYSPAAHEQAAESLSRIADRCCGGRLIALGGGGYNRRNLAEAWTAVVQAMIRVSRYRP